MASVYLSMVMQVWVFVWGCPYVFVEMCVSVIRSAYVCACSQKDESLGVHRCLGWCLLVCWRPEGRCHLSKAGVKHPNFVFTQ